MSSKTGLLLINAGGEMYFIEHGILVYKLTGETTLGTIELGNEEFLEITDVQIDGAKIKELEDYERKEGGFPLRTYPSPQPRNSQENIGPMVFRAFNIEIREESGGQSVITGNGTSIDGA